MFPIFSSMSRRVSLMTLWKCVVVQTKLHFIKPKVHQYLLRQYCLQSASHEDLLGFWLVRALSQWGLQSHFELEQQRSVYPEKLSVHQRFSGVVSFTVNSVSSFSSRSQMSLYWRVCSWRPVSTLAGSSTVFWKEMSTFLQTGTMETCARRMWKVYLCRRVPKNLNDAVQLFVDLWKLVLEKQYTWSWVCCVIPQLPHRHDSCGWPPCFADAQVPDGGVDKSQGFSSHYRTGHCAGMSSWIEFLEITQTSSMKLRR